VIDLIAANMSVKLNIHDAKCSRRFSALEMTGKLPDFETHEDAASYLGAVADMFMGCEWRKVYCVGIHVVPAGSVEFISCRWYSLKVLWDELVEAVPSIEDRRSASWTVDLIRKDSVGLPVGTLI
jgi:hypothetical protein